MRSYRIRWQWLFGMLVISIAAGCGGGEEQTQSETASEFNLADLDACTLLTLEEIRSATGYDPGAGTNPTADVSGAAPMCAWPSADGSVDQIVQVMVTRATSDTYEEYRQSMAEQDITEFSQIEGPGRFTVLLEGVNMIHTFGERFMVQVLVEPAEGSDPVAAATALAGAALSRLE